MGQRFIVISKALFKHAKIQKYTRCLSLIVLSTIDFQALIELCFSLCIVFLFRIQDTDAITKTRHHVLIV